MQDCLSEMTSAVHIQDYRCGKCEAHVHQGEDAAMGVTKQTYFSRPPQMLAILVKRFVEKQVYDPTIDQHRVVERKVGHIVVLLHGIHRCILAYPGTSPSYGLYTGLLCASFIA